MQAANILLVDEEASTRHTLEALLHNMGHRTEAVETGARGFERFQEGIFDVVISDVGLPDMDGIDLIARIRNTDPTVVPMVMAAKRDCDLVIRALETGAQCFLTKPIMHSKLKTGLRKALDERKQRVNNRHMIRDLIQLRTQLHEKMIERERFLDHVLDAAPFGILTTSKNNRIITMNKMAEQMYGCACKDVIGQPINTLWDPSNPDLHASSLACKTYHQRHSGESFAVVVQQRDILNKHGEEIARLYVVEDVSKNEQMEAQLLYAERLSMLGQLAPRIAHEFKTPLQIIMGNVDLALGWGEKNDLKNAMLCIEKIPEASRNLLRLVRQMSNLGKPARQQHEQINLNDSLKNLIQSLQPLGIIKYCDLQWHLDPNTRPVYGDPDQIDQVFRNLIVNAAQAMEDSEQRVLTITTESVEDSVQVTITDTGQGIPQDILEEIFQPFFTTKPEGKGTGLGLPIVKTILDRHSATCHIESTVGKGTSIKVALPTQQA